ncbi:hypothetical protein ANANG_G00146820 [Anguilla anguilla]|uniref:Inner nuclear membrane protein Man1 n=1 Tax=Anguilla anguilla TaxID=7936 RepID=A0A9D3MBW1_ANGAN|nr:hypothetical protein ANANG_G00146820 [Anguilla anguilla]
MATAQLTDEELFSELKRLGFTPGPVTENTRPVYLKKLKKLREEPQRGTRSGKIRNSGSINSSSSSGIGNTTAGGAGLGARPASRDVTHIKSVRSPGSPSEKLTGGGSKFVLGFSSDESDVEVTQTKGGPPHSGRRDRGPGHLQQQPSRPTGTPTATSRSHSGGNDISSSSFGILVERRGGSGSPWWSTRGKSSIGISLDKDAEERGSGGTDEEEYGEDQVERDVVTLNGSSGSLNSSKLGADYSDSDEEDEDIKPKERLCDRRLSSRRRQTKSPQAPHTCSKGVETDREKTGGGVIKLNDEASTSCLDVVGDRGNEEGTRTTGQAESTLASGLRNRNVSYPRRPGSVSAIMGESVGENSNVNWSPSSYGNNHVSRRDCGSSGNRFSVGIRPHLYSYHSPSETYRPNHSNHTAANHASIPSTRPRKLPVPEEELLQQFKRDGVSATGGVSAHYLSMFLLTTACLFFVSLGLMYLRMRGASEVDAVVLNHPFGIAFDSAYVGEEKDLILKVLLHLHDHLAKIAGDHDCGDENHHLNRSLSLAEASDYIMLLDSDYEPFVAPALEWIIRAGEDVGIRLIGGDSEEPVTDMLGVTRLESTHPDMSFACRFRRAFFAVIHQVLLLLAGVGAVLGVLFYMKHRWRREEEETRRMYDMVERIIDVLRSHSEACQENKELQPYLPIPHVRDSLVQPPDRRKMKRVWDRAVAFLSANESRVRTETQRVGGEDFLVWRWTPPSLSCDKMCGAPSKVWQGKAFPLDRRNSPPNSLTPCLKIRNMFDPVMEVGENWHLAIHEAILEKCSDNDGIVHIAVDKNSREAFKALHGSWFDGKLVTVKYLRLDRYHQRFPQAQGCSVPLRPASTRMHSLAHLRQRSTAGTTTGFS